MSDVFLSGGSENADIPGALSASSAVSGLSTGERAVAVPKEYVHLHREEAVLLTGWASLGSDTYAVTARWPGAPDGAHYDPMLITQTIRQSCLVVAHAERGVPMASQTLMERMDFSVAEGYRVPRKTPADLFVKLICKSTGQRSMRIELTAVHDDHTVLEAVVDFSWISPAVYRRLRGEHLTVAWGEAPVPAPVPASTVGRAEASAVVLAPADRPGRWQLRMDVTHTGLYDHPVDHVPGLALIEAAYQAAHAATGFEGALPVCTASSFERYVEFDAACWIDAEVVREAAEGVTRVEVRGVQNDRTAFRTTLIYLG
ncbi:ScbA/BarX family gamma-butyrolactone biosynthesis protein [Streptomyces sp. NPDC059909]|uniref:ScbA/BarX family gamma-butyrolactone biosynthesis protein n=1 Tax=Streptomyces sp. NPDC059909 TaxID=3346998 RepID=UPI0036539EF6